MANENVSDETWRRKDDLSARQTAANVTGYVFEGKEVKIEDFLKYAEKIRAWLFKNQLPVNSPTPIVEESQGDTSNEQSIDAPVPTQDQDKVIKAIAKKVKVKADVVRIKVYEHYKKYPANMKSVDKVISEVFKKE